MTTALSTDPLPCDWTEADWADGPIIAEWCVRHEVTQGADKGSSLGRAIRRWAGGERAFVNTIDRHLTPRGILLVELPSEAWRVDPVAKCYREGVPLEELKRLFGLDSARIVCRLGGYGIRVPLEETPFGKTAALYAKGMGIKEIARAQGISPPTVRYRLVKQGVYRKAVTA